MNQALKPVWGIFFVLLAVTAVSLIVRYTRGDEIIPWRPTYAAAMDEGTKSGKPVFVYFTASWCGPCQGLKHTTWADKGVEAALQNYVPVKVDVDERNDLAQKYNVTSIPAYFVLDREGHSVKMTSGALPSREFMEWLK